MINPNSTIIALTILVVFTPVFTLSKLLANRLTKKSKSNRLINRTIRDHFLLPATSTVKTIDSVYSRIDRGQFKI